MPEDQKQSEKSHEDSESHWVPEPSPKYATSEQAGENKSAEEVNNDHMSNEKPGNRTPATTNPTVPISPTEERTWAMLAHLSVLLNLVTGFLGGVAAVIIYFSYKDRSRLVAYHAMQAFIFQAITWIGGGMLAGIFIGLGSAFAILIIPLLCFVPGLLFLLLIPISIIYGVIGSVKVNNGEDFRYWQVGDWVRDILEPKPIPQA
jgi:uncharacterized protein